jgi:ribosome-binding protein aMBF1 (putative translation factor)
MCDSGRPLNGADSDPAETPHWQDSTCDYCARTVYRGKLHPQTIGRSTAMVCEDCYQRDQERYAAETGQS